MRSVPPTPTWGSFFARFSVLLGLTALATAAFAEGTFVPAASRTDFVHDPSRQVLYIGNGANVLRWDVVNKRFLSAIPLAGSAMGMDLSPDGNLLAVADVSQPAEGVRVFIVNLATNTVNPVYFPRDWYEGGAWTVAFGAHGSLFVTSTFNGSGWTNLRRYNPVTGATSVVVGVTQNVMLAPSADGSVVGFAEANISDGRFGRVRVSDGNLIQKQWYEDGTGWFNFEMAANRNGSQYAIPTYGGTFIVNGDLVKTGKVLGTYAQSLPIGVAYHPQQDLLYAAWMGTPEVRVFRTDDFTQVGSLNFEHVFGWVGNHAFQQGRIKVSRDGSLVAATVAGGVRYVELAPVVQPPAAYPDHHSTAEDTPASFTLKGTGSGTLSYVIDGAPLHGTLSGTAPNLTYTPHRNFNGTDSFTYRVAAGDKVSQPATVTLTVTPVNDAPVAAADSSTLRKGGSATIAVLGNDYDADGEAPRVTTYTTPRNGTLLLSTTGVFTYRPSKSFVGVDSFTYTIQDPSGAKSTATVSITVTKK